MSSFELEDEEPKRNFDVKGEGWAPDGLKVIDTVITAKSADEAEDMLIAELEALGWRDVDVRAWRKALVFPKAHVSRGVI